MRRPRLRLASLMVLVALVAIGLWGGVLWSRARMYRDRAEAFARCRAQNDTQSETASFEYSHAYQRSRTTGDLDVIEAERSRMAELQARSEAFHMAEEWCAEMEARYLAAAARPWISVHEGAPPDAGGVAVILPPAR